MLAKQYKDMLAEESVIRKMFYFSTARAKEIGAENMFDYSLGNPSVPVPEKFSQVIAQLLAEEDPVALHGYSPGAGIYSVREKIAESLKKRFAIEYRPEHIFMTTGSAGALAHAIRCVTQPGDEIITFAPCFPEYFPYVSMSGAVLKAVLPSLKDFQINFEMLENMMTPKTAALLINSPNNPSGIVYSQETIQCLADFMQRKAKEYGHEIYLISDEPYREIVFEGKKAPYIAAFYADTITCYSFSKSLSIPGERIGYLAAGPACKDAETIVSMCIQVSRTTGHNCPSSLMQLAVSKMLDMTSDLSVYETNMELLYRKLTELGFSCVKPGGTFYIFPKALEEDANLFCEKAKKYDLALVPGDTFGCPGYFRMAYCIDTQKVKRSFAALEKFVREEYGGKNETRKA